MRILKKMLLIITSSVFMLSLSGCLLGVGPNSYYEPDTVKFGNGR